jgi:hypothetical protein
LVDLSAAKSEAEAKLREAEAAVGATQQELEATRATLAERESEAEAKLREAEAATGAIRKELEAARATLAERESALASLTGCAGPVFEELGVPGSGESGVVLGLEERLALLPARARELASAHLRRGAQTLLGIVASHYWPLDEEALAGGWANGVPFEQCMALEEGMADLAGKMAAVVEEEIAPVSDEEEEPAPGAAAADPPVNL